MPKTKPHKGLLKRISLSKTGLARHNKSGRKHLRSVKAAKRLRRLRQKSTMPAGVARHMSKLLHMRLRGRNQPLTAVRRSPSPEQKRAMRAEKAAAQTGDE
ncbi:MAG: large ribosomal subunit protein bL35 [Phycisphaerales bacterium]